MMNRHSIMKLLLKQITESETFSKNCHLSEGSSILRFRLDFSGENGLVPKNEFLYDGYGPYRQGSGPRIEFRSRSRLLLPGVGKGRLRFPQH